MEPTKDNRWKATKVFVLSATGAISAYAAEQDAQRLIADGDLLFSSIDELKRVTADWPSPRLIGIWNGIPGVVQVRKFTDRPTAVNRIWQAIQVLEPVPPPENEAAVPEPGGTKVRYGTKKATLLALLAPRAPACARSWRRWIGNPIMPTFGLCRPVLTTRSVGRGWPRWSRHNQ